MDTINAWSYSTWSSFALCNLKAKFSKIDKIPFKKSAAMERGTKVHEDAENFVLDSGVLRGPLIAWRKEFSTLKNKLLLAQSWAVESKWAFDFDWSEVAYFGSTVWVRMVADVEWENIHTGYILDYKTGSRYPGHIDQGELYALGMLLRNPDLKKAKVYFWYIDRNEIDTYEYLKSDVDEMLERWTERGIAVTTTEDFKPTPGDHCRWCDYAKKKGGPCPV